MQPLLPRLNVTRYFFRFSPLSAASIHLSGRNVSGSGKMEALPWMKYVELLTGVCFSRGNKMWVRRDEAREREGERERGRNKSDWFVNSLREGSRILYTAELRWVLLAGVER